MDPRHFCQYGAKDKIGKNQYPSENNCEFFGISAGNGSKDKIGINQYPSENN